MRWPEGSRGNTAVLRGLGEGTERGWDALRAAGSLRVTQPANEQGPDTWTRRRPVWRGGRGEGERGGLAPEG